MWKSRFIAQMGMICAVGRLDKMKNECVKTLKVAILLLFVAAILLAPIIVYIATFGFHITSDHERWGEMGSAMSGIYTPILSILTLAVLIIQVRLQNQSTTHDSDQSYIQEARSDVEFYLAQIDVELEKMVQGGNRNVRKFLSEGFAFADIEALKSTKLVEVAKALNREFPRLSAIWSAYCSRLEGLGSQQHYPYKHNFVAAQEKAIAMVSFETCVALDNFNWCFSEGRLSCSHYFSSVLV